MKSVKSMALLLVMVILLILLSACNLSNIISGGNRTSPPFPTVGTPDPPQSETPVHEDDDDPTEYEDIKSSRVPSNRTPSIIPAYGWEDSSGIGDESFYVCTDKNKPWIGANIRLSAYEYYVNNKKVATPDEFIKGTQDELSHLSDLGYGSAPIFSEITEMTLNGFEAKEFTVKTSGGYYSRIVFVFADSTAYTILCSSESQDKDKGLNDVIQGMLDTLTFK